MSSPKRHHYVAQHYLRRWSFDDKRVAVVPLPLGSKECFFAGTRDLAVEKNLYAIETPDGLDQTVESAVTAPIDSGFSTAIDALLRGEPPSVAALALALGLQMMRGPEVRDHLSHIKTEIERSRQKFTQLFRGEEVDDDTLAAVTEAAEQNEWVATLLSSVSDMAETFVSMRWHFVYFERPMLVTSDSPISYWRRDDLGDETGQLAPMNADEVRLPLSPTLALVMTWGEGEPRRVKGDEAMARELNISTSLYGQQQRIFVVPDPAPVFPATRDEAAARRPVVADLSVLPPLQAHRRQMGQELATQLQNIPGLEDIAAQLMGPPEPEGDDDPALTGDG